MYGIVNNFANGYRVSDENRKNIHEQLNRLNVSGKQSDWWPFYAYYTNLTLDAWENEIINSEIFLNDCKERIEKLLTAMVGIPI